MELVELNIGEWELKDCSICSRPLGVSIWRFDDGLFGSCCGWGLFFRFFLLQGCLLPVEVQLFVHLLGGKVFILFYLFFPFCWPGLYPVLSHLPVQIVFVLNDWFFVLLFDEFSPSDLVALLLSVGSAQPPRFAATVIAEASSLAFHIPALIGWTLSEIRVVPTSPCEALWLSTTVVVPAVESHRFSNIY